MRQFKRAYAKSLADNSNDTNSNGVTPLQYAIKTHNDYKIRKILKKYKTWKNIMEDLQYPLDIPEFDDPTKYFTEIASNSETETFKMILELDPEITDDNIKHFMINCRGNNCMEKFDMLHKHPSVKDKIGLFNSRNNVGSYIIFHARFDIDKIKNFEKRFGKIKIDNEMINVLTGPGYYWGGGSCQKNFEIIQDLENNFEVDYSRLNIGECECSNVLDFIINRRDISEIIDQDNSRNPTDRIIFKKKYDLLWEEKHRYTGSKKRIKEREKCIDILLDKGFADAKTSSVIRYYNNLHNGYQYGPYMD
ncbi:hypothetical protein [Acanthamoeba castellanii mimivirus]|jgi:hypothetical protein|uniref:Uncharacterized protein R814 n=5 Tax=Mimivirus TaxID=315393 RepID=YR814_MIMIV|nr:hypothetical protein MIMI_gp0877 [Acanthamoeba polyphaga mimivirus]Q5UQH1.1 RecName: Full=Uncharacterized protein R814 [Acanthamoeba polyphaga mimivirus]AEQ61029.1 hypothetical protein [Acanthamoeba castellanii mamavirus]AHA45014.1 hypothetical protein HIRU_S108 [Hirudovirus strain Sangsue]AHJ40398.1 hypothetical protein [Samba virus]ALR84462.1 hypothetical protein [Niemeyer virus]AMZ03256.1 hypothetical protein [Mimivirus Bombay]QTF49755.1 hypothetical protein [Mimivirus reunion]WMV6219